MHKIEKSRVITMREEWEKERERCIKFTKENGKRIEWMFEMFGDNLTEKTTFMHNNGTPFNEADCSVCSHHPKPDEKLMHFDFSFCDEYACGMNICLKCLKRLAMELKC